MQSVVSSGGSASSKTPTAVPVKAPAATPASRFEPRLEPPVAVATSTNPVVLSGGNALSEFGASVTQKLTVNDFELLIVVGKGMCNC